MHACGGVIGGDFDFCVFISFRLSGLTLVLWLEGPVGTLSDCAGVTSKVDDRPMGDDSHGEGRHDSPRAHDSCLVFFLLALDGLTWHPTLYYQSGP